MSQNQNETAEFANSRDLTDRRSRTSSHLAPKSAFTLVELLVVISIIAVLAGLITGAAISALNASKRASITLEIQQIESAFEDFKNEYGAYPPNGMHNNTNAIMTLVENDFIRMFKKAFPRNNEPDTVIQALAGTNTAGASNENLPNGMNAAEAMVFWLGGFSSDPQFPISGPGGPSFAENPNDSDTILTGSDDILEEHSRRFEFDLGRLIPRDSNGAFHDTDNDGAGRFITYNIDLNNDGDTADLGEFRRINLWQYAPNGSEQPLVYIDVSRHKPEEYDMHALGPMGPGMPMVHAIEKVREGFSGPTLGHNDLVFVNQGKFQILHAGLDDAWGDFTQLSLFMQGDIEENVTILFPTGPFIGDIADTLGNFGTGTLEDAQE